MGWYKGSEKTLTLKDLGHENIWVKYRPLGSMNYGQAIEFQKKMEVVQEELKAAVEGGDDNSNAVEQGMNATSAFLGELIISWNIPPADADENSTVVLPVPGKDKSVLSQIPLEVVTFIAEHIQGEDVGVSKKTGSEDSPS